MNIAKIAKISKVLFYLVAAWCVLYGAFSQTISGTADFVWIAQTLEGTDTSRFDPIMAIWAHWIGLFLITAGLALFLLTRALFETKAVLQAASVLAIGTISSQIFSAVSLGANGPILIVGAFFFSCAAGASILGFIHHQSRDT